MGYFVLFCSKLSNSVGGKKKDKKMGEFVDSLKEFMSEYNLNNLQLSKLIGVSSTSVNGYFNCGLYPNIETAIKLCRIFDCSLDYLFGFSDKVDIEYKLDAETALDNFCTNLENLVQDNKLSITSTMETLQLDEYTYFHWKHGRMPMTSNVIAIAKYFDVSLDFLIGEKIKTE